MVELRKITKENLDDVLNLKVSGIQKEFVSSNAHSLAQAWVYQNTAFPFAIYNDNTLVGFIMLGYYEEKNQYTLWKFMIDEKFQNKGYGRQALRLAVEFLKNNFKVKSVFTGCAFDNNAAKAFYRSFGFRETGVTDEVSLEMELKI